MELSLPSMILYILQHQNAALRQQRPLPPWQAVQHC